MNARLSPQKSASNSIWTGLHAAFLDALFPPRCAGCAAWSRDAFCQDCHLQLKRVQAPLCDFCGEPFDPLAFSASICARCRARPSDLRAARAVFHFEGPARLAIHRLKYHQKRALAPRLAPYLSQTLQNDTLLGQLQFDFLVPIPLHPARLRLRGFNQSSLLAHELSRIINVPTRDLLSRTRNTPPQVGLKGKARAKNVQGAFAISKHQKHRQNRFGESIERILLIDDVFTTGATLGEAAKVLRKAGAETVCALTLAR